MVSDLIPLLRAARSSRHRAELIRERARRLGCPESRVRRHLAAAGWGAGRKRRRDAGTTMVPEESLEELAAALRSGIRSDGRATMHIPAARRSLEAGGMSFGGAGDAHLARLLRDRGISLDAQRGHGRQHLDMASDGPNDVHQVDPSVCLIYYSPTGRQHDASREPGAVPYKNKPARKLKVWRYLLVDHWSGCIALRYYEEAGENQYALWDFLCYAWSRKEDPHHAFFGMPVHLVWDAGSANTSAAVEAALAALETAHPVTGEPVRIRTHVHRPGNARAKGSVESMQRAVETMFESRLRLQPVASVAELNRWAALFAARFNACSIPDTDTRLRRRGRRIHRLESWLRIAREELREPPPEARDLMVCAPVARRVAGNLTVTLRHPRREEAETYRVGHLPGARAGGSVDVQPLLMSAAGDVLVRSSHAGTAYEERLQPVELNDVALPVDGRRLDDDYEHPEPTEAERTQRRIELLAGDPKPGEAALAGRVRALDALRPDEPDNVVPFPRPAGAVAGPAPHRELLGAVAAARHVRARLGEAWRGEYFGAICRQWPGGATEAELDAWMATLTADREMA